MYQVLIIALVIGAVSHGTSFIDGVSLELEFLELHTLTSPKVIFHFL